MRAGGWCRRVSDPVTGSRDNPAGAPEVWRSTLVLLGLGVLWLGTRAYPGVTHDARLYAAQALAWADPARFAGDLFFAFGSQDSFTLFSFAYGPLVAALGVPVAHAVALGIGHAAWLLGAWMFASAVLPDARLRAWAMAGAIAMFSLFGGAAALTYGEPFVTPRLFAEAATLAAIGCALRGRPLRAGLLLLGGTLLHPLIALPGAGFLVLWRLLGRRGGLGLALAGGALALAVLPLLPATVPRLDPEWREVVAARSPFLLVTERDATDVPFLAKKLVFGLLVLLALDGALRRLALAALLLGVAGLLATLVGGDVAGIQLVVAAQPWRATWLMLFVVNLLLVPALMDLRWQGFGALPGAWPALCGAVVLHAASRLVPGLVLGLLPVALLALLHLALHRAAIRPGRFGCGALRLAYWAVAIGTAFVVVHALRWLAELPPQQAFGLARQAVLMLTGGVLVGVATMTRPLPRVPRAGAVAAGTAAFALAVVSLDQRPDWDRFLARPGAEQAQLRRFIPDGTTVFWDGGLELLWFRLGRASYFSCAQAAGVVFHRGTAIAFRDRAAALAPQRLEGRCFGALKPRGTPADATDLVAACRALPALDHIVLADRVEDLVAAAWSIPVAREIPGSNRHMQPAGPVYRYDCAMLRDGSTPGGR